MRWITVLALLAALCGQIPTGLHPVRAVDAAERQMGDADLVPIPTSADAANTSADPPAPTASAWKAALVSSPHHAGAALRSSGSTHPAQPRLVAPGSSHDPDTRSRQHVSLLTVSLRI
jgi:hypothetical protein